MSGVTGKRGSISFHLQFGGPDKGRFFNGLSFGGLVGGADDSKIDDDSGRSWLSLAEHPASFASG